MKTLNVEKLNTVISKRLASDLEAGRISSADIIVSQKGKTVFHTIAGYSDITKGVPLAENSMFRLASMTKPVSGIAALVAVEKGYFSLSDDLADYLPEFSNMQVAKKKGDGYIIDHTAKEPLKIWHMLSHVNGVNTELDLGFRIIEDAPEKAFASIKDMTEYCASAPLNFDPGRFSAYSGYSPFDVIARIIEIKSGMPYAEFVKKFITEPLGISDLCFLPTEEQWNRMVKVSSRVDNKHMATLEMGRHIFEAFPLTYTTAGAGMAGSSAAYNRFAQMLLGKGTLDGVSIISPETFAEYVKCRVSKTVAGRDPDNSWGLGIRVVENQDYHLPAGSFGWSGAYGCHFWVDPVNEITAVYLRSNNSYGDHGKGDVKLIFEKDVMSCAE